MTDRQYRAWHAWLKLEWDEPDRSDHYLMQAAMETCRFRMKNPGQVRLEDFRIRFRFREQRPHFPSEETRGGLSTSKAFWLGQMTLPVEGLPDELKTPGQLRREREARRGATGGRDDRD